MFLLTGLQARTLIEKAHDFPVRELLVATALTTAIVIVGALRLDVSGDLSAALADPVARASAIRRRRGSSRSCSASPACAAWCRSPRRSRSRCTLASGAPFPHRDLILFVTFGVIIITLVGQGLMLPAVIRWLGVGHHGKAEHRREQRGRACRAQRGDPAFAAAAREARQGARPQRARRSHLLNARHDHRERLIPSDLDDGLDAMRASNDAAAGADRGRTRVPLRTAARRQDHRRIAAAARTRARSGGSRDPGAARRRNAAVSDRIPFRRRADPE